MISDDGHNAGNPVLALLLLCDFVRQAQSQDHHMVANGRFRVSKDWAQSAS
jgi:hypothetical protein